MGVRGEDGRRQWRFNGAQGGEEGRRQLIFSGAQGGKEGNVILTLGGNRNLVEFRGED